MHPLHDGHPSPTRPWARPLDRTSPSPGTMAATSASGLRYRRPSASACRSASPRSEQQSRALGTLPGRGQGCGTCWRADHSIMCSSLARHEEHPFGSFAHQPPAPLGALPGMAGARSLTHRLTAGPALARRWLSRIPSSRAQPGHTRMGASVHGCPQVRGERGVAVVEPPQLSWILAVTVLRSRSRSSLMNRSRPPRPAARRSSSRRACRSCSSFSTAPGRRATPPGRAHRRVRQGGDGTPAWPGVEHGRGGATHERVGGQGGSGYLDPRVGEQGVQVAEAFRVWHAALDAIEDQASRRRRRVGTRSSARTGAGTTRSGARQRPRPRSWAAATVEAISSGSAVWRVRRGVPVGACFETQSCASRRWAAASAWADHDRARSQLPRAASSRPSHMLRALDEDAAAQHGPMLGVGLQPLHERGDARQVTLGHSDPDVNVSHNRAAQRGQRRPRSWICGAGRLAWSTSPASTAPTIAS